MTISIVVHVDPSHSYNVGIPVGPPQDPPRLVSHDEKWNGYRIVHSFDRPSLYHYASPDHDSLGNRQVVLTCGSSTIAVTAILGKERNHELEVLTEKDSRSQYSF